MCQADADRIKELEKQLREANSQISRQKSHIERYKAQAEKRMVRDGERDFFDAVCDATDGITGTLLSGNEKTIIRQLSKAILFTDSRPNRNGAIRINKKRIIEASGDIQRGDAIIDKLIQMDLFVVDGSEPHGKDELWLIVPSDIVKRLQNIPSEFKRGHGHIYCSKCGHTGAPIVRERGHRKLLCECCLYTVSECDFERDIHRGKITKSEKFNEQHNEYLPELKPYRVIPEPEDFESEWEPDPEEVSDDPWGDNQMELTVEEVTTEEDTPTDSPINSVIIPFPTVQPRYLCPICNSDEWVISDKRRGTCYCQIHPRAIADAIAEREKNHDSG